MKKHLSQRNAVYTLQHLSIGAGQTSLKINMMKLRKYLIQSVKQ